VDHRARRPELQLEPFDPQPHLVGRNVELKPLCSDDYDALYAAASDPLIWELHPDDRWREDVFRDFFTQHLASGGALLILDRADGSVIGTRATTATTRRTARSRSAGRSSRARTGAAPSTAK